MTELCALDGAAPDGLDTARCLSLLAERGAAAGLTLTEAQLAQFGIYYEKLVATNRCLNLTALTSPEDVAVKHFIDSLLAFDPALMKAGTKVIDVGTGAAFPACP